ncbi:hypothetical protein LTR53_001760 [Teratosphaeriaceae sp. CCFEE 6253]|nr:hypothetical protein LTR53_001760 [Teratosphaeriaceae sp. CCFEE 6253]
MEEDDPYQALSNEARVFIGLHDAMMSFFEQDKDIEAVNLAEKLLAKAHLPILIRARCHMMLSRRINDDFSVEHAERAVEILDVQIRGMVGEEDFPELHLEEARELPERAKERPKPAPEVTPSAEPTVEEETEPTAGPSHLEVPQPSRRISLADQRDPENRAEENSLGRDAGGGEAEEEDGDDMLMS